MNINTIFYPLGDSLYRSNGMEFSTFDKDNDESSGNCAANLGGANWWRNCGFNNMNGKYERNDNGWKFMWWWRFENSATSLKSMTIMFRQVV